MLASHMFAMLAKIWSSHLDVRLYTLCRLPLTALSLVFLLFSSPHIPSSQPTSARDAPNSPQLSAGRFIAMLQIQPGETRREVALRVDRIAMAIGSDVEAQPLFIEDRDEARDTPAQHPLDYLFMLKINEETALAYGQDALVELFGLEWVEPDFIGFGAGRRNVTDGHHHQLLEDVRLSTLSGAVWKGQSVMVAILDTGTDVSHASLFSRVVKGFDFLTNTNNPHDDQGQGTSVAGIIGAGEPDETAAHGADIDPMLRLMPLKVLDHTNKGFYSDFVRAIRYAVDQGAQVINLGVRGQHESRALRETLRYAARNEVVVISPMMSDGTGAAYYPAAYPETIAIGAVDKDHRRFSNSGRHIDVVAYGDDILTTDLTSDYHYSPWWGNSNACAIVSGMVALLKAQSPTLSPVQIKEILQQTARDRIGDSMEDTPGWDPFYGYGLISARDAFIVAQAISGSNQTADIDNRHASTSATYPRKMLREGTLRQEHTRKRRAPQDYSPGKVLSSSASGGVELVWHAPTTNADGTLLTDLAGYKLYYGQASRRYTSVIDVGNQTTYMVFPLEIGSTYYFAVTAYNISGNGSSFSSEVSAVVLPPPSDNQEINAGEGKYTDGLGDQWNAD